MADPLTPADLAELEAAVESVAIAIFQAMEDERAETIGDSYARREWGVWANTSTDGKDENWPPEWERDDIRALACAAIAAMPISPPRAHILPDARAALDRTLTDAHVSGHGEGQEHAMADVSKVLGVECKNPDDVQCALSALLAAERERGMMVGEAKLTTAVLMARQEGADRERALSTPADLRADGWMVAVHNDYRLNGETFTFYLVTRDEVAIKGEGRTDGEALDEIRARIRARGGK